MQQKWNSQGYFGRLLGTHGLRSLMERRLNLFIRQLGTGLGDVGAQLAQHDFGSPSQAFQRGGDQARNIGGTMKSDRILGFTALDFGG